MTSYCPQRKEGWVKQIPVDELLKVDKDFKVGGRAPRGQTVKVFIQYLGQRRVA